MRTIIAIVAALALTGCSSWKELTPAQKWSVIAGTPMPSEVHVQQTQTGECK